jgi:hypothetical protein
MQIVCQVMWCLCGIDMPFLEYQTGARLFLRQHERSSLTGYCLSVVTIQLNSPICDLGLTNSCLFHKRFAQQATNYRFVGN